MIIFAEGDVEVLIPTQLTIDISLLRQAGVLRHTSALDSILFIWVKAALWCDKCSFSRRKVFVKILLYRSKKWIVIHMDL